MLSQLTNGMIDTLFHRPLGYCISEMIQCRTYVWNTDSRIMFDLSNIITSTDLEWRLKVILAALETFLASVFRQAA